MLSILKKYFYFNRATLLIFLCGLFTVLIFAPFKLFFLAFLIYPYFLYRVFREKFQINVFFNNCFYFYLGFYFSNFYWISFSFLTNIAYKDFFPIILIIIPIFGAILASLFFLIFYSIFKKLNKYQFYLVFCVFFIFYEYIRSNIIPFVDLQGLPWGLLAYSLWNQLNILQIVGVIGTFHFSALLIFLYSSPFLISKENLNVSFIVIIANIAIFAILLSYGKYHIKYDQLAKKAPPVIMKLKLVHSNIITHHNFDEQTITNNIERIIKIANQSSHEKVDFIVLPEGVIAAPVINNNKVILDYISTKIQNYNYLVVGTIRVSKKKYEDFKYYNSLFLLDNKSKVQAIYHKKHLVPFGEYNPYSNLISSLATQRGFSAGKYIKEIPFYITKEIIESSKQNTKKEETTTNEVAKKTENKQEDKAKIAETEITKENIIVKKIRKIKRTFLPLICYDGIFENSISNQGDFLLNITNDIWFTKKIAGKNISVGPWQHFQHIRFRAIEKQKPLVRVANYGITAVTDKYGKVEKQLDFYDEEQVIIVDIKL